MKTLISKQVLAAVAAIAVSMALAPLADAAGGGGGRGGGGGGGGAARAAPQASGGGSARASGGGNKQAAQVNNAKVDARTNNVRSTSVNNTNVNVNRNVNVNVEGGGCCNNGWDNDYHPVATAAAVTATVAVTAAIVGSIVNAPPPGCVPVNVGGVVYQQCGSTWYQPQGSQFVVVNAPM